MKGWMKNATVSETQSKATDLVKVKSRGVYRLLIFNCGLPQLLFASTSAFGNISAALTYGDQRCRL